MRLRAPNGGFAIEAMTPETQWIEGVANPVHDDTALWRWTIVPQRRGRTLALRWLVTYSRDRREKHMADKLAGEILDALEQQGGAFKKKDDMYRMAQANKAFAHYRW